MPPPNDMKIVMDALVILGRTGGSIVAYPNEHRRWKVKNEDCVCNSTSLVRACKAFIEDFKDRAEGILS